MKEEFYVVSKYDGIPVVQAAAAPMQDKKPVEKKQKSGKGGSGFLMRLFCAVLILCTLFLLKTIKNTHVESALKTIKAAVTYDLRTTANKEDIGEIQLVSLIKALIETGGGGNEN